MWEGYVCSRIRCLPTETNISDDALSRKILANIFTKFDWRFWACFLQSIFRISVFLRFSMILKSVIQEIVSKLIPDLVVILVAISLNAFVFMKFPFKILFPFTKNFSSQNFEILKTFYIQVALIDWNVVSSLKVISRLKRTDSSSAQVRTSVILFLRGWLLQLHSFSYYMKFYFSICIDDEPITNYR